MAERDHRYLALSCSQHDAHGGRRFGVNTNTNAYSYRNTNTYSYRNSNGYGHGNSNSFGHADSDAYFYAKTDAYTAASPDTEASPDSGSTPLVHQRACRPAVFSGKLPSMEAEIDCKVQSNFS
jgi:hypothetical protein